MLSVCFHFVLIRYKLTFILRERIGDRTINFHKLQIRTIVTYDEGKMQIDIALIHSIIRFKTSIYINWLFVVTIKEHNTYEDLDKIKK